ncbi:LOW QUALITY PROTEIN: nestin [Tyto alba]|uniref:LOW QUALITY PROTEIN: nestin n=1 Tax=Tyto alba TaxID=56313 RepID=UPI001C67DFBD|nr:LOW QUALITY PROTEIN: nestin [Tyto alba]
MLSTESFAGARALGEESLQMWDLNKRLEAYLARVKFLEEENEVLRAEIQSAKGSPAGDSWRAKYEEELRALRDALDHAFREKCTAELARDNLYEEVQQVKSRCQKEQAAREEAKKLLSLSRKELEEERRAQIWLKERAVQLEKEVEALLEVHEEEKAGLDQEIASFSQSLESFRCAPVAFQPVEVEDYSKRLSEIWKGAVETYKTEVSQLEGSLCQAKENLWKAVEDNQQSQLQLQHLEKDLAGLKARKEMLEENLARQWQEQRGEAEKFQLAMEALEQEKQSLRVQIAQVLEDRQQLMHLKMSLSLEVATYRTLLEAESTRLQMPAGEYKLANGLRDLKLEVSSGSKLAPASTDARRLLPWDHRASPSIFSRAEGRGQPAKTQSDSLTPKSQSSGTRELQKISSVLHATAPQTASTTRELGAPICPSQPGKTAPPLSPEPPSHVPPEPGSPGGEGPAWPGGAGGEMSQGKEHPPPGATAEPHDASVEPLGTAPARSLRYPAQLVSEALEDALKEMKDDAQPKEEPTLSAAWGLRDTRAPSPVPPIEACGGDVAAGDGEGQDPSEGARDGEAPEVEERAGEAVVQGLGAESRALRDGAASPPGPHPCGTAASRSAAASQEELGVWEEEMPSVLSSREPEVVAQEEDTSDPGQMGTTWEEPEQEEDEAPSTEASHPSEDEEERGSRSPCGEDSDFQGEGMDVREGESPQREVEAAHAVLVESHLVLPTESHLEEDFVDGEQEKSEQRQMPMCEMDLAAEEEREQETCLGQEPSSIHEAIPTEGASSGAEEDAVGEEDPGRAKDGEGEKGEAVGEVLVGEDLGAGEAAGPETLGHKSGALEEPGDLQENGFEEQVLEQELEPELGEEPWGKGDNGNGQKPRPEDWEVTAEDTEGALGTEEPAWADDTPTSAGGLESEERGGTSPAELEETQEDDEEDAESQGMSQQQPPPEAEPALELARDEQDGTTGQPAQAPADVPGQGDSQEPAEAPEEPGEVQDEDADDELGSEPGQPESSSTSPAALQQVPGDGTESGEAAEEDAGRPGELELVPGVGRRVELEDTLPDSTPLHLYEGEMLAEVKPNQNAPETEETTETAPASKIAPEDEGWLEGKDKPPTPTVPESHDEEAGMEVAPVAEGAEEEEGYFMVSAPNQEVSSSEEAEISEDFEEIKVEAIEASKDDLEAPGEASPVPEDEGHFEAFVGEADEDMKIPPEEPEMPKDEDEDDDGGFTAELEEGMAEPEADPGSPRAVGLLAGGEDEPARGAAGSGAHKGPGCSEDLAAESIEELDGTVEPERDAGTAETLPGCNLGLVGQEEEEEEEEEEPGTAHHDTAEPIPPAELQARVCRFSPLPDQAEQTSDEQPFVEEEAPDGDSPLPAGDEEPPEADPPQPGSAPEQGGFPEMIEESPGAADLSAKVPVDVMKDSDILEIVEQALEFNQELVMGVRAAEGGQRDSRGTELPQDAEEDSSPASSSEEEPTVQEAPADAAPGTEGLLRAENGLHREASLEDLAEFTEEVLNGIAGVPPAQEFPAEPSAPGAVMPLQPPAPGDATAAKLADATPCGKHGGADTVPVPSALGDDVLCLAPDQPPACRLRAEQEPWSLGDE